jgi:hypothetical protein
MQPTSLMATVCIVNPLAYTFRGMELAAAPLLYERRVPLKLIAAEENTLRQLQFDSGADSFQEVAERVMGQWARVLELSLFSACVHEAVLQLELMTAGDVLREFQRVDALARLLSRLDPDRVLEENRAALEPYLRGEPKLDDPATSDTATVVRSAESLLLHCPIADFERAGRDHGLAAPAHRCRLAYDGLRAFVRRHSQGREEAVHTAGRLYAEGRASVSEVAAMLAMEEPDVVALLEEHGFRRSVEGLRLEDGVRSARLAAMRADRLQRRGEPAPTPSYVVRDVIASQRIEDIDARPWLRS